MNLRLASRNICFAAPRPDVVAYQNVQYVHPRGVEMERTQYLELRDDIYENASSSWSSDNGMTWSEPQPVQWVEPMPDGICRRSGDLIMPDPVSGQTIGLYIKGLHRRNEALDGLTTWAPCYWVSDDGGHHHLFDEPVVQQGSYTPAHPFEDVWIGRNAVMAGWSGSTCWLHDGRLLVAMQMTVADEDGALHNPGGGYTWTEAMVVIGQRQDNGRFAWEAGPRIALDASVSTRGALEPTVASFVDGRLLMVLRGSNDAKPQLPGCKWYCVSDDQARTWTPPRPWPYDDGRIMYSPSSISQLVRHSNGRCYWFGNVCPENPRGNGPRYPLVCMQVDNESLLPIRDSLLIVDDRRPDEDTRLALSNFKVYEDRVNHELVVIVSRYGYSSAGIARGDAWELRVAIDDE